ncbi:hypothetical protein ACE3MS_31350 [Paenibacillus dendritiformis]|uniref:hypothetical protein n=1 Tax=Paenibacillus dendritiformis TaxID=130049 RepID=UPI003651532E
MYDGVLEGDTGNSPVVVLDDSSSVGDGETVAPPDSTLEEHPVTVSEDTYEFQTMVLEKLDAIEQHHQQMVDINWWLLIGLFVIAGMLPVIAFFLGKGGGNDA